MQTPPPLKKDHLKKVVKNGAECSEYNGKNNKKILRYIIFELLWKMHRKLAIFRTKIRKNDHNSKNKNRKNLKIGFSFYSADFWSST